MSPEILKVSSKYCITSRSPRYIPAPDWGKLMLPSSALSWNKVAPSSITWNTWLPAPMPVLLNCVKPLLAIVIASFVPALPIVPSFATTTPVDKKIVLNCSISWYMPWNDSFECPRHVLKPYLPSEHV